MPNTEILDCKSAVQNDDGGRNDGAGRVVAAQMRGFFPPQPASWPGTPFAALRMTSVLVFKKSSAVVRRRPTSAAEAVPLSETSRG